MVYSAKEFKEDLDFVLTNYLLFIQNLISE